LAGLSPPGQRRLLLVPGSEAAGEAWLDACLGDAARDDLLYVAGHSQLFDVVPPARIASVLGREYGLVVVNAHQGFHPDAFAAAAGTLRGGGDCVLLTPPLAQWPAFADPDKARFAAYPRTLDALPGRFLARLVDLWAVDPAVVVVDPSGATTARLAPRDQRPLALNHQQQALVDAIGHTARGHARRPLVILADRGRGKSTVLGCAAARLLADGLPCITVVAVHRAAVQTLFRHALGGAAEVEVGDRVLEGAALRFRLPLECIEADDDPGLVLVDEASAIALPLLERLLQRSNRLVFATTVHGYEGSGRGFVVRFAEVLDRQMPQWRRRRLEAPVRWAVDDPLEALLNRGLLLDADIEPTAPPGRYTIRPLDVAELCADEALLRRVFGLLVNAHYQTRPSDLRQLLDNPDVRLWVAMAGDTVVGVAWAVREGDLDPAMAEAVLAGRRRPRGHLLPQSLAVHAGLDQALACRFLRVQRIAVHPGARRRGIGRELLRAAGEWGVDNAYDLLATAFAATPALHRFWCACGFRALRVGLRLDPAGGSQSLFMARGLGARGATLVAQGAGRFQAGLPWSLGLSLAGLDAELAVALLHGRDTRDLVFDAADRTAVARLAVGARPLLSADGLLWRAVVLAAARGQAVHPELAPAVAWLLQHQSIERVCRRHALAGRGALEQRVRGLLSRLDETGFQAS
jgi:tRNA(Met) cytidine acetyltransferase